MIRESRNRVPQLAATGRLLASFFVALTILAASCARAEPLAWFLPGSVEYDPEVVTPSAALGHELGARPARIEALTGYLKTLAAVSPRLRLQVIGHSHEGREIVLIAVSSPENLARLDEIRVRHVARALGAQETTESSTADVHDPIVIWLNYGVHGAEASGLEAVVPTAYHLAAARGGEVEEWLEKAVILLVAPFNPDGHARRVDHVERFSARTPVIDPASAVHDLWIAARTNHYWFDLNRQWLLVTQPESQAWVKAWQAWRPDVSADFHEMGSNATYYFHPGVPSRRNPLIPEAARALAQRIADFHRAALDASGRLYYSEESFDNFYPGKGSTYPQLNGSVGFLFEAAAARGGAIDTPTGVRTLAQNIRTHFRTSLSTIRGALANARALAEYRRSFIAGTRALARADAVKADLVRGTDPSVLADFATLLAAHRIRVHHLARVVRAGDGEFRPTDSLLIPRAQPQYRMIRTLFDRVREFGDTIFYDVSGWTMPDAFGLAHATLNARRYRAELAGAVLSDPRSLLPKAEKVPDAAYGYLLDWRDLRTARVLHRLLLEGFEARVAMHAFHAPTAEGVREMPAGTIFLPARGTGRKRADLAARLQEMAKRWGISVLAVTSGHTPDAGTDFGSRASFRPLKAPRVVLAFAEGLAPYEAGEAWFALDVRFGMPVTMVRLERLARLEWPRYTHLVLVGGHARIGAELARRIARWVREEGGTLIAMKQQARWAENALLGGGGRAPGRKAEDDAGEKKSAVPAAAAARPPARRPYAELPHYLAERQIGGAIFGSRIDPTHPLAFGLASERVATMRNTTLVLGRSANPFASVAVYDAKAPLLSGWASAGNVARIAGTPMLRAEGLGRGRVILFADDPNFRAVFRASERLFVNALFFASAYDVPPSVER